MIKRFKALSLFTTVKSKGLNEKFLIVLFFITFFLLVIPHANAKRIALVIGNNDYRSISKLEKAVNDANSVSDILKKAGFEVNLLTNLDYRDFIIAIDKFSRQISEKDQVVFYYAGHGVQFKSGNFLLPIDINAESQDIIEKMSYNLDDLALLLGKNSSTFQLIIVDACRNDPFPSRTRSGKSTRGLIPVEPVKGQLIVYSASRGQEALDRLGPDDSNPNGIFTRKFISKLPTPGLSALEILREVQDDVEKLASSVHHEQRPAIYDESRGSFYFFGTPKNKNEELLRLQEENFWNDTKAIGTIEGFNAYMQKYPSGTYSNLANAYLSKLQKPAKLSNDQERQNLKDELAFWNITRDQNTRKDYQTYLIKYPNGFFVSVANDYLKVFDEKEILLTREKYANLSDKKDLEKDKILLQETSNRVTKENQARISLAETLIMIDVPTF